ncbi:1-(5-phosphoribosyl)-5-[(5-phosphoribosylamino)methylideneamino]imidazole-4-carboxamide isomerase [Lyngbya confervoides]|uniref:1-(5-phosphoribosyl)-5-[(5-phosphoribosylamino)methylideneamino] imidazole-4-carboxamide isomerase n=1 Tax=Lyngbya confervoides BDU141951 TaxID=1574623 RepID=A0ABD4T2L9_9CYAN|nr:1-(5-phosphoribosyl)-5-[(5-phosphoribosylamino)methylideneamino]imidazole-4-carboxamide isomerase [Lyngbya confervoides]MCM1982482.1 1-(5-phosphoribosyl)-5-[(5-phosphoribosylamino)methylideneamino]imidazole-4-carboxamide isomerase [Lyngbya confervoides BDU141951]
MDVIPAIDLLEGKCVRLYQGDYQQSEVFSEDPVAMAQHWQQMGAPWLHLVDLDGAKTGEPTNLGIIAQIAEALSIPIQVGGGLRSRDRVAALLALGVQRAILGTVALENPDLVRSLCQEFPGQILVGIDARHGKVATRGWLETSSTDALSLAQRMEGCGVSAIIYTDIQRDGTLSGPNLPALREMATALSIPVIASGGISSITDLLSLLSLEMEGVSGAIVGRALYTHNLNFKEALQAVGPGRLQDVPGPWGSTAIG